jgi:hypothetical protein
MSWLNEALIFPYLIYSYRKNFQIQKKFMETTLEKELQEAIKTNDGSLSEKDIVKIRGYYGNSVPSILGEGYAILREQPMTPKERECLTYLGGLTGLFDDLFDEKRIDGNRLQEMINKPNESQAETSFELLFLKFYLHALSMGNRDEIIRLLNLGYHAQMGSLEQVEENITQERISEVTRNKGGVFLQFYRAAFSPLPSDAESEMLFNIGAVGQLENDIFDMFKDYQDGIKTLATTCNSIRELSNVYQSWIEQYEKSLQKLHYSEKAKEKFERFTRILYLRGKVCLSQYMDVERKLGGTIDMNKVERKDLLCDMGRFSNQFKLAQFFISSSR